MSLLGILECPLRGAEGNDWPAARDGIRFEKEGRVGRSQCSQRNKVTGGSLKYWCS
ncbi:hypothetical protein BCR44DRAFT_1426935 [Catenaria anguillulae PL171]|uniref:Uncharacterized protein n=1 Tax=Catenaria anguillulae PL171 TaxID=765915 RepID=A0A1Y2I2L3_9FUNG|nr:hypothetical protein BCR44DRAFT_1426935 [Catenaria anguillulae PL171]